MSVERDSLHQFDSMNREGTAYVSLRQEEREKERERGRERGNDRERKREREKESSHSVADRTARGNTRKGGRASPLLPLSSLSPPSLHSSQIGRAHV